MDTLCRTLAGGGEPGYGEEAEGGKGDETDADGPADGGTREAAGVVDLKTLIESEDAEADDGEAFDKDKRYFHAGG